MGKVRILHFHLLSTWACSQWPFTDISLWCIFSDLQSIFKLGFLYQVGGILYIFCSRLCLDTFANIFPVLSLTVFLMVSFYQCCCCSVTQSCPTLCNPMDCSTPCLPAPHHLLKFAQVHVDCTGDAIHPSHPLTPFSPSAFHLSQHQGLFQWVICSHQTTKILEF